jgi:SAM-dependent methyltransferase
MTLDILQSPARHPLRKEDDRLVCTGTGRRYSVVNGTPQLFDEMDVSPFLRADFAKFAAAQQVAPDNRGERWAEIQAAYRRARAVNTDILFQMEHPSGMRVLEFGVGDADLITRFGHLGHEAWALDFFPWDMEKARDVNPVFRTISAPMSRLPFRDASFDFIYCHAALHHALPNDHADFEWSNSRNLVDSLREVRRILKPSGRFFLLGEGVYEEGDARVYEAACQVNAGVPYESTRLRSGRHTCFRRFGSTKRTWSSELTTTATKNESFSSRWQTVSAREITSSCCLCFGQR